MRSQAPVQLMNVWISPTFNALKMSKGVPRHMCKEVMGNGSGFQVFVYKGVARGGLVLSTPVSGSILPHVSSNRMASISVRDGACPL